MFYNSYIGRHISKPVGGGKLTEKILLGEPLRQPHVGREALHGDFVPLPDDPLLQGPEHLHQHLLIPVAGNVLVLTQHSMFCFIRHYASDFRRTYFSGMLEVLTRLPRLKSMNPGLPAAATHCCRSWNDTNAGLEQ